MLNYRALDNVRSRELKTFKQENLVGNDERS